MTRIHETAIIGFSAMTGDHDISSVEIGRDVAICPQVVIGHSCRLGDETFFDVGVKVGDRTRVGFGTRVINWARIHEDCSIGERSIISGTIPERTTVGRSVRHFGRIVHSQTAPFSDWLDTDEESAVLCDGSFVGADALLIGPVTVGHFSYVAAGEVVRGSIPDFHLQFKGAVIPNAEWRGKLNLPSDWDDAIVSTILRE